ncbi:hypothetical protein ABZV75_25410 [Streptomyces flaveolus]
MFSTEVPYPAVPLEREDDEYQAHGAADRNEDSHDGDEADEGTDGDL